MVFLIVFNILFFVAGGTDHPISVWISYGFIHLAYIMLLMVPLLIRKSANTAVLGFSLYFITLIYFLIVLAVGLVFIFLRPASYKTALIVQVNLAGIYAAVIIAHMLANERTAASIERQEMKGHYIKDASSKLKSIMDSIDDEQLRKQVERLYDLLHSSPVKSEQSVREYELKVLELADQLEESLDRKDIPTAQTIISKIEQKANERNRRLKYGN